MYKPKKKLTLRRKLSIVSVFSVVGAVIIGVSIWQAPALRSFPVLEDRQYQFTELGNRATLADFLSNNSPDTTGVSGFLLDLSSSACPFCVAGRDLPNDYYEYYKKHGVWWSNEEQDKWLKGHGKGNGPVNDYASGYSRDNADIFEHNVVSIYMDGYKVEDSNGLNFQNNPLLSWAWELISNKCKLFYDKTTNNYWFELYDKPETVDAYDSSYAGWLNNNTRATSVDTSNHWYWGKKDPDDKKEKEAWHRGYAKNDTSWYNIWPLLCWFTYSKSQNMWEVNGWVTGYYEASKLQDLSDNKIQANDKKTVSTKHIETYDAIQEVVLFTKNKY